MPNMFYGRMMFRLEAAPTGDVHWTFIEGSGLVAGQTLPRALPLRRPAPGHERSTFVGSQLMANYETPDSYSGIGPGSDCWQHANKVVDPRRQMVVRRVAVRRPEQHDALLARRRRRRQPDRHGTGAGLRQPAATYVWTAPTFDRMDLGWESYQQDSARTIWIDDVVLSKTKVGCPQ